MYPVWFTGPQNEEGRMYGLTLSQAGRAVGEDFILLLGELSDVSGCGDRVSSLLLLCAETLQHRHYPQHINLLETLLKRSSDNALVQSAGVDCLTSLCQLLGRMILRGRIEQHNPTYLDKFDRTVTVV
ncbi:uncharacterized protein LOC135349820 isoform X3 [Halichondria panicea]|uniref:uncharacterized protein LOC135349820 isoform X3 n=1 Tax=Halichondria panicea TaxID=6063 RepID=UPI00312B8F20